MIKVIEEKNISSKNIKTALAKVDFQDTFSVRNKLDNLEVISNKIFNDSPKWIEVLFIIRAYLVKLIGLKSSIPEDYNEKFIVDGYVGFFKIYKIEESELILGLNDKHLNFRVSILNKLQDEYNIKVTTLVEFNNFKGRLYMKIIAPFHRIVVKSMVKKAFL